MSLGEVRSGNELLCKRSCYVLSYLWEKAREKKSSHVANGEINI